MHQRTQLPLPGAHLRLQARCDGSALGGQLCNKYGDPDDTGKRALVLQHKALRVAAPFEGTAAHVRDIAHIVQQALQ